MSLGTGTRVGPYEIQALLGAGGMGEVYRARDTKLGRDVALKILPDVFAGDAERLARFDREARTLASLNHPHIAQLHGLEDAGQTRALVMEFVDGEDLSTTSAARADLALSPDGKRLAFTARDDAGVVHLWVRDLDSLDARQLPGTETRGAHSGRQTAVTSRLASTTR